jgi:hypothetical protein
MSLSVTVGGARGTFEEPLADEVAGALDHAFGAEGEWEGEPPRHFGEVLGAGWTDLQRRAQAELGRDAIPNLLALGDDGRGVYLPTHVRAISLPLPRGAALRCASLPGLRQEFAALSEAWGLPLDDAGLNRLLDKSLDPSSDAPALFGFARLALAANEAVRRDCPLWLVGIGF